MKKRIKLIFRLFPFILFIPALVLSGCNPTLVSVNNGESASADLKNTPYQVEEPTLSLPEGRKTPTQMMVEPQALTATPTGSSVSKQTFQERLEHALHEASLNYVASSPEEADEVVREMGYIDGQNESASNACGPLSIAIMRDAGLLPNTISLHEIWLLNLREDSIITNVLHRMYFPPQTYDYIRVEQSVGDYDFQENPLQPGDWLFLYTARNGFDHMLVVTRVDESGAAYTVTNIDRGEGFVISEERLFDPMNPRVGLFYELSDPEGRRLLGLTGTAGFIVVRRKGGISSTPCLNPEVKVEFADQVKWHVLVKDISSTEVLFESLPYEKFQEGNLIKVPLAIVALRLLEEQRLQVSEFNVRGYQGRTFDQLFKAMIINNETMASEYLLDFIRQNGGEMDKFREWGIIDTMLDSRMTTGYDLAIFLEGLYKAEFLDENFSHYLLDLMKAETEYDGEYLGIITSELNEGELYNKPGLSLSPTTVSDMGILEVNGQAFLVVINGTPKSVGEVPYEEIVASLEHFALRLGKILLSE